MKRIAFSDFALTSRSAKGLVDTNRPIAQISLQCSMTDHSNVIRMRGNCRYSSTRRKPHTGGARRAERTSPWAMRIALRQQ
ncbi:hypothetical protein [Bradyrhizobium sp. NAS96.2]|uniref:hypothetical protein n=1 Tax=Bradyrhizobium sp. NAS96.2 TaxID=1680160 RepID=UPI00116114FE|nr:hypothetical protein [Bradyrhizobium sp. NAS96.2]